MDKTLKRKIKIAGLATLLATSILAAGCATTSANHWQSKVNDELPVLGHRNWIVIADSAYPAQSRPGIETIATGADQIAVVEAVLRAVDKATHVRANVYLDAEMKYVAEQDAPGIDAYRRRLALLLDKREAKSIPHEELIAKLDEAAKTFRILILKTNLTLPYTSVFLQLDCGYWSPQAEQRLRQAIREAEKSG
ncbi:MAG TPA: RbsD/FucU domain-containing protein [Sedimentisphaerales bacterium]|nr:RbsD/FucU domain-containing protein [Sedimentisphaerales bacterium]